MSEQLKPISLAFTGASGSIYGLRLLEYLIGTGRPV
jgi:3-polyprenyl-4-hydroxybenzoate decarboxylase